MLIAPKPATLRDAGFAALCGGAGLTPDGVGQ